MCTKITLIRTEADARTTSAGGSWQWVGCAILINGIKVRHCLHLHVGFHLLWKPLCSAGFTARWTPVAPLTYNGVLCASTILPGRILLHSVLFFSSNMTESVTEVPGGVSDTDENKALQVDSHIMYLQISMFQQINSFTL